MFQIKTKVIKNIEVAPKCYKIRLFSSGLLESVVPGQFVMVKINGGPEILLRRPFSVHAFTKQNIEILYETVGKATGALSQKKPGEYLDMIGPLGNGFSVIDSRFPIIVAGGMGVAPLYFLAEKLVRRRPLILIGARTKKQVLCEKEFRKLGCDVEIATDDGSKGSEGKVTELLQNLLSTMDRRPSNIYACGPKPMLKEISRISKIHKIPAQISLEEHMACGIGACLGCVVETMEGLKRVCKDGPVFNAGKIVWQ